MDKQKTVFIIQIKATGAFFIFDTAEAAEYAFSLMEELNEVQVDDFAFMEWEVMRKDQVDEWAADHIINENKQ